MPMRVKVKVGGSKLYRLLSAASVYTYCEAAEQLVLPCASMCPASKSPEPVVSPALPVVPAPAPPVLPAPLPPVKCDPSFAALHAAATAASEATKSDRRS